MKGLTWVLVVFSGIAILGILTEPTDDGTIWGVLYAGAVIAQGVMVLNLLKNIERESASKKVN